MKYRRLKWKYKYQLIDNFSIKLPFKSSKVIDINWVNFSGYILIIRKGYCWDGATCAIDTNDFMIASLVHDALYQLIRAGKLDMCYRIHADSEMKRLCLKAGMSRFRAFYTHSLVRLLGKRFLGKVGTPEHKIYEIKELK